MPLLRQTVVLSVIAAVIGIALGLGAWILRVNDPTPYEEILDRLHIPASWELVLKRVRTQDGRDGCSLLFGGCPASDRFYLADPDLLDTYQAAKQLATGSGFEVEDRWHDCQWRLDHHLTTCLLAATRGPGPFGPQLWIVISPASDDTEGLGLATPDRSLVRITAQP